MAKKLVINTTWCKGCGICAAFCPKGHLEVKKEKVRPVEGTDCILCGACEMRCPDYAIYVEENKDDSPEGESLKSLKAGTGSPLPTVGGSKEAN